MPEMANRNSLARRTFLPVLGGAAFIVILAAVLWLIAVRISHNSQTLDVHLGDDVFKLPAKRTAERIVKEQAPLLFPDLLVDGSLDIYVNHFGSDTQRGWVAFAARPAGEPRPCNLVFPIGATKFSDPCTNASYPATGQGLPQFAVDVTPAGTLQIDLTPLGRPGGGITKSSTP